MIVWTYQPVGFDLETLDSIHPELSQWWQHEELGARYRELLPRLFKSLGCEHFLWCCSQRGWLAAPGEEIVEWQLAVPEEAIVTMLDAIKWDELLRSKSDDFSGLLLPKPEWRAGKHIDTLVRIPLPTASASKIGLIPDVQQRIAHPG